MDEQKEPIVKVTEYLVSLPKSGAIHCYNVADKLEMDKNEIVGLIDHAIKMNPESLAKLRAVGYGWYRWQRKGVL
jgi:hypothetical protein